VHPIEKRKGRKAWLKQEKGIAKELRGRRQPGSGSVPGRKGDVVAGNLLVEAKVTSKLSFSLKLAELTKIMQEAHDQGRVPAFCVRFDQGGPRNSDFVVLTWEFFKELMESYEG